SLRAAHAEDKSAGTPSAGAEQIMQSQSPVIPSSQLLRFIDEQRGRFLFYYAVNGSLRHVGCRKGASASKLQQHEDAGLPAALLRTCDGKVGECIEWIAEPCSDRPQCEDEGSSDG